MRDGNLVFHEDPDPKNHERLLGHPYWHRAHWSDGGQAHLSISAPVSVWSCTAIKVCLLISSLPLLPESRLPVAASLCPPPLPVPPAPRVSSLHLISSSPRTMFCSFRWLCGFRGLTSHGAYISNGFGRLIYFIRVFELHMGTALLSALLI